MAFDENPTNINEKSIDNQSNIHRIYIENLLYINGWTSVELLSKCCRTSIEYLLSISRKVHRASTKHVPNLKHRRYRIRRTDPMILSPSLPQEYLPSLTSSPCCSSLEALKPRSIDASKCLGGNREAKSIFKNRSKIWASHRKTTILTIWIV